MWGLQLFVSCLTPALLSAVRINAKGREIIYLAKGDSVKLGCPYELEPQDHGPNGLDIEWTQLNSDPTNLDNVILSYHDHQVIHPGYHPIQQRGRSGIEEAQRSDNPNLQRKGVEGNSASQQLASVAGCCSSLQQRVNFALQDPSQYDASIHLQNVQIFDTATYECKVKKTSVATRKVTVTVLERPSTPQCSIKGKIAMGHGVNLACTSGAAGTPPLHYQWTKVADYLLRNGNWLSPTTVKGVHPGDLVIRKLSQEHVGIYQCRVTNKVGSAQCSVEISFSEDSNQVIIIVGTVLGSLLCLVLILCLILGLIYCRRKRQCKEEANQIRVDTAPPSRQRPGSKNGSLHSVLGFLPNNLSFIQRQKYDKPKDQEGVKMISPGKNAVLDSVVASGDKGNKTHNNGPPAEVTTKASVHCKPTLPSYTLAKSRALNTSHQLPISSNPGRSDSSVSKQDALKVKRCHPGQYRGVPVMVPAKSREGLVL